MNRQHFLLIILWVLFAVIHSLLAAPPVKGRIKKWMQGKSKYYPMFYAAVAVGSMTGLLMYQFSLKSEWLFQSAFLRYGIGLPLAVIGLSILIFCIKKYFLRLTGLDIFLVKSPAPILETTGLHAFVRHPLYLGTFIFITGLFCCYPLLTNLIAVHAIIAYTLIGIQLEEKKLLVEFGDAYTLYKKRVPMIIPLLRG